MADNPVYNIYHPVNGNYEIAPVVVLAAAAASVSAVVVAHRNTGINLDRSDRAEKTEDNHDGTISYHHRPSLGLTS